MKKELLIYTGPGVSERFLPYLKNELHPFFNIHFINKKELLNGEPLKKAAALIIPGGRDIYYHQSLQGLGNQLITQFVINGGNYIGICAGAYYASSSIEFAKNSKLEVLAERDLKFIDATAVGPVLDIDFSYDDKTAKSIDIFYQSQTLKLNLDVYYHGGCTFKNAKNCEIFAYYDLEKKLPAIVFKKLGKGRVLLSGVHFEFPAINEQKKQKAKRLKMILDILKTLDHSLELFPTN